MCPTRQLCGGRGGRQTIHISAPGAQCWHRLAVALCGGPYRPQGPQRRLDGTRRGSNAIHTQACLTPVLQPAASECRRLPQAGEKQKRKSVCEGGCARWPPELSEGRGQLEEARGGVLGRPGCSQAPLLPPAGQPGHQMGAGPQGSQSPLFPRSSALGPALDHGSVLENGSWRGGGHSRCRCTRG